jgi:flagellar motor protein MotB
MPRGQYTYNISSNLSGELAGLPKVSQSEYETLTELYQAENAVGIAVAAGGQQYAPDTLARSQQLLQQAQQMHNAHDGANKVIQIARQASETAEDARLIAAQQQVQSNLDAAKADAVTARRQAALATAAAAQAQAQADEQVRQAKIQADAAIQHANALEQQLQTERAAASTRSQQQDVRPQTEVRTQQQQPSVVPPPVQYPPNASTQTELRARMLNDLGGISTVSDTPRGLVITLHDADFSGDSVRGLAADKLSRVAAIVSRYPGLSVRVEGFSESPAKQGSSESRAQAVSRVLVRDGMTNEVTAVGYGDTRPVGPPGEENSRVEVIISGSAIGSVPSWGRTYSLR